MTLPARMPPELWPQVSLLFDEALALPESEHAAWLAALDTAQPAVAPFVRQLLATHASAQALIPPSAELLTLALGAQIQNLQAGTQIGIYTLIEPLGQGGMATVWDAAQTQGVMRRVALKLPHPGIEAPAAMASRFERERDLLAGLEHPHIARLYDAGISQQGQPFLAMELISGVPITQHAKQQTVPQRLKIFLQVLDAVAFAHGRLVIHRDIKPSNILVTSEGQVKLLDFGIARLLGDTESATGTLSGRAFTPDCASPEQLAGGVLGVTSDVYSLGVVLYEVLTGQRPYAIRRHSTLAMDEQLQSQHLAPPSSVAPVLQRALLGDLDAIVARAMAYAPAQRYPSADALVADLQRHLNQQPVLARGNGRRYRAGRFVRRHALGLSASAAVVLAMAGGLGVALWQAEQARSQALRAQAVQRFIVQVFNASHPQQAQGQTVSAKALLDQGAKRLSEELQGQPEVRAELHLEVGGIYNALGDNAQARVHTDQALALYASLGQLLSERAIEAQFQQFELLNEELQFDAARVAAQRVQARALRAFGPAHRWWLPVREKLAWMTAQQGDASAAELQLKQALAEAPANSDPVWLLRARATLGSTQLDLGRAKDARDTFLALLAASSQVPQHETTDRLIDRYNLARARYMLGEFTQVNAELATLVPEMERHIGPRHDRTIKARSLWAQAALEIGQYNKAVSLQRENLAQALARETRDDEVSSIQRLTLAKVLRLAGRYAEGLPEAQQGLAFMDDKYSQPTWFRVRGRWIMAELMLGLGQQSAGIAALEQAAQLGAALAGYADNPAYADVLQAQALALGQRGRVGDLPHAQALQGRARAVYISKLGADSAAARRAALHLHWLALLAPEPDAAAQQAFDAGAAAWAAANPLAAGEVALMRAQVLLRAGRAAPAQAEQARGAALWQQALGQPWSGHFIGLH
jgi:eukaryotic-like serine/threonine-protein kinase